MSTDSRLRDVLGDDEPDAGAADWADGYGITSPDVQRYIDLVRSPVDALSLELRELAASQGVEVADIATSTLISLLVRSHRPMRVLEIGTGVGLLTLLMARAAPDDCTITSIDANPVLQTYAHEFLHREQAATCAVELRVGNALRLLDEAELRQPWDIVLLNGSDEERLHLVELIVPLLMHDGLLIVPWALRGGRTADSVTDWAQHATDVDVQRHVNRRIVADARLADVTLLPVGDGLLVARRDVDDRPAP